MSKASQTLTPGRGRAGAIRRRRAGSTSPWFAGADHAPSSSTWTRHPTAVAILTSASSEKRDARPRSRSFMRGCVIAQRRAASVCVQRLVSSEQWPRSVASTNGRDLLHQRRASAQIFRPLGKSAGASHTELLALNIVSHPLQFRKRSCAISVSVLDVRCALFSNVCKTTTASTSVWVTQWIVESSSARFRSLPATDPGVRHRLHSGWRARLP